MIWTSGQQIGAPGGGLANTAGNMYNVATARVQDEDSTSKSNDNTNSQTPILLMALGRQLRCYLRSREHCCRYHSKNEGHPANCSRQCNGPRGRCTTVNGSCQGYQKQSFRSSWRARYNENEGGSPGWTNRIDAVDEAASENTGNNDRSVADTGKNIDEKRRAVTTGVGQQAFVAASSAGSKASGMI